MIIDPSILILLGILIGGGSVSLKWYLQYREKVQKQIIREEKEQSKPENRIQDLLAHLPEIMEDRRRLYMEACKGPEGDQSQLAKSLRQQISMLETVSSIPQPVIELASPILSGVLKAVSRFIPR